MNLDLGGDGRNVHQYSEICTTVEECGVERLMFEDVRWGMECGVSDEPTSFIHQ